MNFTKRVATLLVAALMLTAAAGPAMAATPVIDTESTNTTTTSDWTDGTTVTNFSASADDTSYVEVSFSSAPSGEAGVKVVDQDTGETYYQNESAVTTDDTNNHYAWNISHDELSDIPVEAGMNKTVNVTVYDTQDMANATTIAVTLEATTDRSVAYLGDSALSTDDAEIVDKYSTLSEVSDAFNGSVVSFEQTLATDGSNTTHTFELANETADDSWNATTDADTQSGDWLVLTRLSAEDADGDTHYIPVFANSKGEWDFLDDNESYAVYDTSSDEVTVNLGEEFKDNEEVTFEMRSNEAMGFNKAWSMFGGLDASLGNQLTQSLKAFGIGR
jgi:hypothetical protein